MNANSLHFYDSGLCSLSFHRLEAQSKKMEDLANASKNGPNENSNIAHNQGGPATTAQEPKRDSNSCPSDCKSDNTIIAPVSSAAKAAENPERVCEKPDDNEGKSEEKSSEPPKTNEPASKEENKSEATAEKDRATAVSDSVLMPHPPEAPRKTQSAEERKSKIKRVPTAQWKVRNVSDYEILDLIGKGTFGKVFKAKLKNPQNEVEANEIVALKRLNMAKEEEGFPITALREVQILKKLHHKNVVMLKDIVVDRCKQSS